MSLVATGNDTLEAAIRTLISDNECELPVLPEVAAQLLKLTGDVDCEVADIVVLIKRDQSLTTHLLRIANSARYSTGVQVSSVQQAVARLGLLCVREITVLIACQCKVFDVAGFEKQVQQSFRRSLAAAVFSQEIARERRMNVEEAFLGGLLHDVGRPVLLQSLSDRRKRSGLKAADHEILDAADEHRIPLSARLIRSWGLSARVAEAVEFQCHPEAAPDCSLQAATVRMAIDLALDLLGGTCEITADVPHPSCAILNLYPEQFAAILRKQNSILEWVNSTT
jgi:HD-like signal output (HDOD) protein